MAERFTKRDDGSDAGEHKDQAIESGGKKKSGRTSTDPAEMSEETANPVRGSDLEEKSALAQTSHTFGAETREELVTSDPSQGTELPMESALLPSDPIPRDKSPAKRSLLSRAKGIASRSFDAVRRTLSPKSEPSISGEGSGTSKEATEGAVSRSSPHKSWIRWKNIHSPGKQKKGHGSDEHEPILLEDKPGALYDEEAIQTRHKSPEKGITTPKKSMMQRYKDRFAGPRESGSSVPAPCPSTKSDQATGGSGAPPSTSKDKRSMFSYVRDLAKSYGPAQTSELAKIPWTFSTGTLELSMSETTAELDLDEMGSSDRSESKVISDSGGHSSEGPSSAQPQDVAEEVERMKDEKPGTSEGTSSSDAKRTEVDESRDTQAAEGQCSSPIQRQSPQQVNIEKNEDEESKPDSETTS